jgi:outer membrane lipoprotein
MRAASPRGPEGATGEPRQRKGDIMRSISVSSVLAVLLALTGCATGVPEAIRQAPPTQVAVADVQREAPRFIGQTVRWGGSILAVHNRAQVTEIELLARPLGVAGEPDPQATGTGRFLAEIPGFLDPAEYPEGRRLTVSGRLVRTETRPVGDYPYAYPVVATESWHLWPEPPEARDVPYYGYPWYDRWYPYRPWHYPYPW